MSKRVRDAGLMLGASALALAGAGVVALAGGSSTVAWWVTAVGCGLVIFTISEVVGVENWVRKSPRRRRLYLGVSASILLAAVAAYVMWDTVALWWLAPIAAFPLYLLLMWEPADRRQSADDDFSGPLTPPDGNT